MCDVSATPPEEMGCRELVRGDHRLSRGNDVTGRSQPLRGAPRGVPVLRQLSRSDARDDRGDGRADEESIDPDREDSRGVRAPPTTIGVARRWPASWMVDAFRGCGLRPALMELVPDATFPDLDLPDHTGRDRRASSSAASLNERAVVVPRRSATRELAGPATFEVAYSARGPTARVIRTPRRPRADLLGFDLRRRSPLARKARPVRGSGHAARPDRPAGNHVEPVPPDPSVPDTGPSGTGAGLGWTSPRPCHAARLRDSRAPGSHRGDRTLPRSRGA